MSKKYIIANWKCNPNTLREAEHLFNTVNKSIVKSDSVEVVLCVPYIYMNLCRGLNESGLKLGGQNCHWEKSGAYTGEISADMLKNIGCEYVIIGHSERRNYFGETDEVINRKIEVAIKASLTPILCIGEKIRDNFDSFGRQINEVDNIVEKQLTEALAGVSESRLRNCIITYEPVWAISTSENSQPCSPNDVFKAILFIRKILTKLYSKRAAEEAVVIYGGSVDDTNAAEYIKEGNVAGLLVGGASLNATKFLRIMKSV